MTISPRQTSWNIFCCTPIALYALPLTLRLFALGFWYGWHTDFGRNKKCLSLAQSLQSTVQYKSVWTSLRTRVVQVTQHSVISSPFPRHCRRLLLCSNNIQFLWDSRSYSISPNSVPPRREQRVKLLLNNEFNKWLRLSEVFGWRVKLGLSCLLWAGPVIGDFSGKVTMQV